MAEGRDITEHSCTVGRCWQGRGGGQCGGGRGVLPDTREQLASVGGYVAWGVVGSVALRDLLLMGINISFNLILFFLLVTVILNTVTVSCRLFVTAR